MAEDGCVGVNRERVLNLHPSNNDVVDDPRWWSIPCGSSPWLHCTTAAARVVAESIVVAALEHVPG